MIHLAVPTEYRRLTDKQTDRYLALGVRSINVRYLLTYLLTCDAIVSAMHSIAG